MISIHAPSFLSRCSSTSGFTAFPASITKAGLSLFPPALRVCAATSRMIATGESVLFRISFSISATSSETLANSSFRKDSSVSIESAVVVIDSLLLLKRFVCKCN